MLRGGLNGCPSSAPQKLDRTKLGERDHLHYLTRMFRILQICVLAFATAFPAVAEQLQGRLIVQRSADAIEVFFSAPGQDFETVFGFDPAPVTDETGHVDFDLFLEETAPFADAILTQIAMTVGGNVAAPEGLAFMLHPVENTVEFSTPWDALLTITGCTVAGEAAPIPLENTDGYFGAIIYPTDGRAPLQIYLPRTGRNDLVLEVLYFNGFEPAGSDTLRIPDGAPIVLDATETRMIKTASLPIFAIIAAGGMFLAWRLVRRRQVSA